jgi:hypothetical protein
VKLSPHITNIKPSAGGYYKENCMKKSVWAGICSLIIIVLAVLVGQVSQNNRFYINSFNNINNVNGKPATLPSVVAAYQQIPLSFEVNQGQAASEVKFLARGDGYNVLLMTDSLWLGLRSGGNTHHLENQREAAANSTTTVTWLQMQLLGAQTPTAIKGFQPVDTRSHYLQGNDAQQWVTNVNHYQKVTYQAIYPGIDLTYYGKQRELEYDFTVAPQADWRQIRLAFPNAQQINLAPNGDLLLTTSAGTVRQRQPIAYQEIAGARRLVKVGYKLLSTPGRASQRLPVTSDATVTPRAAVTEITPNMTASAPTDAATLPTVGLELANYDPQHPLVIDPVLNYATYLGGDGDDFARAVTVDPAGNVYIAGDTVSTNFVTANALQPRCNSCAGVVGTSDVFVTKLNPNGDQVISSTYLGGNGPDTARGIAVDTVGNIYIAGDTSSANFPISQAFQSTCQGCLTVNDAFVAKINATGNQLLYSSFLGGTVGEIAVGIAVDLAGNASIAGTTNSDDFPVRNSAQPRLAGDRDAFVARLDPNGQLIYTALLGGVSADLVGGVAVDPSGNTYLTGTTMSDDFPVVNALQSDRNVLADAFVAKLDPQGLVIFATFLGGERVDEGRAIAVNSSGEPYIFGRTNSVNFPVLNAFQASLGGRFDNFLTKLDATGMVVVFSTYLGGGEDEDNPLMNLGNLNGGGGLFLDRQNNIYLAGQTESIDFPMSSPIQPVNGGGFDAFIAKFDPQASTLIYATFLGDNANETGNSIAIDNNGNAYVVGSTLSSSFPVSQLGLQRSFGGGRTDAFVAKINDLAPANIGDFQLNLTSSFQVVQPGQQATFNLTIQPQGAFRQGVRLNVMTPDSTPGIRALLSSTVANVGDMITVTVATQSNLPVAGYPIVITGVAGNITHTATATVNVVSGDFSLSLDPATQMVPLGTTANFSLRTTATNGLNSPITLNASVVPFDPGVRVRLSNNVLNGTGSVNLSVTPTIQTQFTNLNVQITARSGLLTRTIFANVIAQPPDFSIRVAQSMITATPGLRTTINVMIDRRQNGNITINAPDAALLSSLGIRIRPASVTTNGNMASFNLRIPRTVRLASDQQLTFTARLVGSNNQRAASFNLVAP